MPSDCTHVLIMGRACLGALGQPPPTFPPVTITLQEQCFHLIAGRTLVDAAVAQGSYLMSPAWLRDWRLHIAELGFTPDTVGEFYRDFAHQLVLLDTGVEPMVQRDASEFSKATGLPYHSIAVGLDHVRLILGKAVLEWRLAQTQFDNQQNERAHRTELADHACALDLLGKLTLPRQEAEVIAAIEDLFRMLFAPNKLQYLGVEHKPRGAVPSSQPGLRDLPLSLASPYVWTADGNGFALLFAHDGQELGRILVDGLAFVQYRERYLNMALSMTGVCALALESARARKRLVEAEKMASLGVMVAGIAHEINTPVGVSALATSTVQRATTKLAESFAARTMTQSDLQTYFNDAQFQTGLVLSNLQRIGRLIDAFRQVAVNGLPQTRSPMRLGRCIQDVISSLGERMSQGQFTVRVACDDHLEIQSYPGDWSSILTNLVSNSLQHGFKGRDRGCISISARQNGTQLLIEYTDDGNGLSVEVRKRIFDPFFTTDLQNGMGLGMHLVYNVITQRMGGTIACQDPVDRGAHFHIEVPVLKE